MCPTAGCFPAGNVSYMGTITLPAGTTGGPGGRGGRGQAGGGGAGGPSHAIVLVGTSTLATDGGTTLSVMSGGSGAGGAPSGRSQPIATYP